MTTKQKKSEYGRLQVGYDRKGRRLTYVRLDAMTYIYQTHCLYAELGQVVVVRDTGDGTALFVDICRGVYGIVTCPAGVTPEDVETAYLYGSYTECVDYRTVDELTKVGGQESHRVPVQR